MCTHGHLGFFLPSTAVKTYSPFLLSCALVATILNVIRGIISILHASLSSFLHGETKAHHVSTLEVVISSVPD